MTARDEWEEFAASYIERHPEISAAVPYWAEEVEFNVIAAAGDKMTEFTFTRTVGMVTLWGSGTRDGNGVVQVDAAPDIIFDQRGEFNTAGMRSAWLLASNLAGDIQSVADILDGSRRTLRRQAGVDDRLRELEP